MPPAAQATTPRQRVLAEAERAGAAAVARRCASILSGKRADPAFVIVLGGEAARQVLDGREGGVEGYWPRVWALRALLYAWDDAVQPAVLGATADPSWRVREMAAKVLAVHGTAQAGGALDRLAADPVPRVRHAAARARRRA